MTKPSTRLFAVTLCALGLATAADTPPPLKIHTSELPNGLKIVLAEDRSRPVINLQVWYHVGSKDEKTNRTGFARTVRAFGRLPP